ncbi:MAG: hypothetical protein ACYTEL_24530 [Planctomycetota bacterium]
MDAVEINVGAAMSRICFVFAIFCFTAVMIVTVSLRTINDRIFYKLCVTGAEQSRLRQKLWHKQLELENLINPAAVSERLGY